MYGCAACWVQVRERRRAAACLQPAAPQGVAVANQFAALPVEEPAVRHETLRHVITECEATEGRQEMAEEQTVKSIQRGDFPTRRAAAARAAPSTPRLVSAARVGPVVYGLLLAFRGDGYG